MSRTRGEPPWRFLARAICLLGLLTLAGVLVASPWVKDESSLIALLKKKPHQPHTEPEDPSQDPSLSQISLIDYIEWYSSLSGGYRVAGFIALIVWLVFLFAFVGITASDFFSPNLATLSSRLGLSEAVAGSTLLAFGNGSPDVFSTFAALRSNAGSLAVGELLGAASFIVSFVAGSMCLVGDFKVAKHAFLRDVGFFLAAVVLFSAILLDGKIARTEAGSLIILYLFYVAAVTIGSWWHQRKMRQREMMRKVRGEYADDEPYRDEPASPFLAPTTSRSTARTGSRSSSPLYSPALSDEEEEDEIHELANADAGLTVQRIRGRARSSTTASSRPMARSSVRPSLLSAVEFRDVVNSLRAESADERTLGVFRAGDRGHRRAVSATFPRHQRKPSSMSVRSSDLSPAVSEGGRKLGAVDGEQPDRFARDFGKAVDEQRGELLIDLGTGERNPWTEGRRPDKPQIKLSIPEHLNGDACTWSDSSAPHTAVQTDAARSAPPAIVVTDASPQPPDATGRSTESKTGKKKRFAHLRRTLAVLFPSLQGLGQKSLLGISLGVLSAPAILVLTLTLPVVDEEMEGSDASTYDEKGDEDTETAEARRRDEHIAHRLHAHDTPSRGSFDPGLVDASLSHLRDAVAQHKVPENAIASPRGTPTIGFPTLPDDDEIVPKAEELHIAHVLVVFQCVVSPFFFLLVTTGGDDLVWWYFVVAAAASAMLGVSAFLIERSGKGRLVLCFVGFAVAVLWIMMIVNEVVGVLQAIGHIFGLSDALIGLTIFAIGNSLGDLVANLTIARMGYPVMAISACYGGPMLNILLGVGMSGTYFTASTGKPYHIKGSWALTTTSVALLVILIATLIVVPMNGYIMTRKWGLSLMASYFVLLVTNVAIELSVESRHHTS